MDPYTELAKLMKKDSKSSSIQITTGEVLTPPPNITIRMNDVIILDKSHLILSAHLVKDYEREVQINGSTASTLKTTDTLKQGDEVILLPSSDLQTFVVIDKAVRY